MTAIRYGQFVERDGVAGRAFRITDPGTPRPWVNVVSNGRYGFVVSQHGGGFCWYDNSQYNVLTRWEMDLTRDDRGRFLLLRDLDKGETWSLAPAPCRVRYDRYSCTHAPGRTTFATEFAGIAAEWTLAVAPEDPVEVWAVRLENRGGRDRRLRIASFFEWCCGVAPDSKREFHRLFFTTRHDTPRRAVFATRNMWDVPARDEREHWNRSWPYVAAHALVGPAFQRDLAIGDKEAFLGPYGDPADPAAMREDIDGAGTFGRFGDAVAALGGDFALPAGESVRLSYLLTIGGSEHEAGALIDRYAAPGAADQAVADAGAAWEDRLAPTSVKTDQPDFDALNNTWLPYQAISGRLWGRTGYYQQSGAFGFRDQLQDSQVWLPLDPGRCKEQILLHAAHQFADGSVYHWWHPLTETGLRTQCSDDYLWLPFLVVRYVKETGDFGILEETAPFVDDAAGATLLDHCLRSLRRSFARTSPRGLPLIGSCDWNDGLSALGVGGRGESVWLGFFLCSVLGDFARLLERVGDRRTAMEFGARRGALEAAVNEHAWDGEWFRCATRDDGTWIGSRECREGRIHLNPQTWAVLSGAADKHRADAAWASVKRYLLADMGPLLLAPAHSEPDPTIGYITRYAPGLRENGGVYMHAATWALAAACARRDVETVDRIWRSISPPVRAASNPDRYAAEPYVTPGNVDGPQSQTPGRAGWTWYTGSAAWLNRVSLEWVLGIKPEWDGLLIDPCPPPGLGKVDVTRTWRGRQVRVRFDARRFRPGDHGRVVVNGEPAPGRLIPPPGPGEGMINVEVEWGAGAEAPAPAAASGRSAR